MSVNSRPSNPIPVSPERRLDLVLGSASELQFLQANDSSNSFKESIPSINPITASGLPSVGLSSGGIQFSDHNPGVQKMARPIPTFNSFGIIHQEASISGQNGLLPVQDTAQWVKIPKQFHFHGTKTHFFTFSKVQKHTFWHFQKYKNTFFVISKMGKIHFCIKKMFKTMKNAIFGP